MEQLDRATYYAQIEEIARDVTAEAHRNGEDLHDALNQTIDSHEWVVYNRYHLQVAAVSDSDDAWTEIYGGGDVPENFDQVRAYYAMEQDVREHDDFGKLDCIVCGDTTEIEDLDDKCRCVTCEEVPVEACESCGDLCVATALESSPATEGQPWCPTCIDPPPAPEPEPDPAEEARAALQRVLNGARDDEERQRIARAVRVVIDAPAHLAPTFRAFLRDRDL